MSCSLSLLSFTYSSKYSRLRSSRNCVAFSSGTARNKTGGVSSSGPPVGFPRFAHCTNNSAIKLTKPVKRDVSSTTKKRLFSGLRKERSNDGSYRNLYTLNLHKQFVASERVVPVVTTSSTSSKSSSKTEESTTEKAFLICAARW